LTYVGNETFIIHFSLCAEVSPEASTDTFLNVAKSFFSDGVYNWGRVGSLFYFAYKMVVKVSGMIHGKR